MRGCAWWRVMAVGWLGVVPLAGAEGLDAVVAGLDAMRLPARSFRSQVELASGGKSSRFEVFARRGGGVFRVLMVCEAPARDAGKRLLFAGEGTWLHDPRARRPTKLSPQQLWSEGAMVDSLAWSLARDFEAKDLGRERLEVAGGGEGPLCRMVEFKPLGGVRKAAGTIRYWVDDRGWPRQVVHLTASGRAWRTIHATEFSRVMGRDRPTVLRVQARGRTSVIRTRGQRAFEVPADWVDPEKFGVVEVN